MVLKAPLLRCY